MVFPPLDFLDSLSRVFQVTLASALGADAPKPALPQWKIDVLAAFENMPARDRQAFEHLMRLAQPRGGRRPKSIGRNEPW
jgi:hypothetical protein